jgi:hypothetical protein
MFEPRTFGNPSRADMRTFNCQPWRDALDQAGQLRVATYGPPTPILFERDTAQYVSDEVAAFCEHPTHCILAVGDIQVHCLEEGANWYSCTVLYQELLPNGTNGNR